MHIELTEAEAAAVIALGQRLDLSHKAVVRQAISFYQMTQRRLDAGETLVFSGDAERARLFRGPVD